MIIIRKAVLNDEPIIEDILKKTGLFSSHSNKNMENAMVIETEDLIAGCGCLQIIGEIAILKYLSILPEYRSQGLGDGLTRALVNYADRRNVKKIYLLLSKPMDYFKRFGFKNISSEDIQEKYNKLNTLNKDAAKITYIMELDIEEFFNNRHCHS